MSPVDWKSVAARVQTKLSDSLNIIAGYENIVAKFDC